MFGIKNERTVRKKMEKYDIKRRTLSEAMTVKMKMPFTGDLAEKAYFLGLRTGDFHGKWVKKCIRLQTSTTHDAQLALLLSAFHKYATFCKYLYKKPNSKQDEWFIYVDLHPSFDFLVEKPTRVPSWILNNDTFFFNFLAAYMDCEGNWHLTKSHEIHARFTFRLRTGDKEILENVKRKLESLGYITVFSLDITKGTQGPSAPFRKDMYNLTLNGRGQASKLAKRLIPLSMHSEKVRKMRFMLKHKDSKYLELVSDWNKIKNQIKKETLPLKEDWCEDQRNCSKQFY